MGFEPKVSQVAFQAQYWLTHTLFVVIAKVLHDKVGNELPTRILYGTPYLPSYNSKFDLKEPLNLMSILICLNDILVL